MRHGSKVAVVPVTARGVAAQWTGNEAAARKGVLRTFMAARSACTCPTLSPHDPSGASKTRSASNAEPASLEHTA
jgi:hypothetical protein